MSRPVEHGQNGNGDFGVWYQVGQAGMVTTEQAPFIYVYGGIWDGVSYGRLRVNILVSKHVWVIKVYGLSNDKSGDG